MDKSKAFKVGIQFAFLRACCKNKYKGYFKNLKKKGKKKGKEIEEWESEEEKQKRGRSEVEVEEAAEK